MVPLRVVSDVGWTRAGVARQGVADGADRQPAGSPFCGMSGTSVRPARQQLSRCPRRSIEPADGHRSSGSA